MIAALTELGVRFRHVEVVTEGTYLPEDVDWNYKDVPHLNQVHGWASNVNGVTDRDAEASLNLQRILGIRLPLVLSHYETAPYRHTYFFTLLFYSVVCETTIERTDQGTTRVVTNYGVGSSRVWMLAFPLIAWALRRNYHQLMTEDVPMRERREQLRSWGYTFRGDGQPRTFPDSLAIERNNVVVPTVPAAVDDPPEVSLDELSDGVVHQWGRSDHLGVRLQRRGDDLEVFPRLCPHEGAALDEAERADGCVRCPWHGREIPVLGVLRLEDGACLETEHHRLHVRGNALHVQQRSSAPSDSSS